MLVGVSQRTPRNSRGGCIARHNGTSYVVPISPLGTTTDGLSKRWWGEEIGG